MPTENIPGIYLNQQEEIHELFIYDLKMNEDSTNTKVNLNRHMFSFLQTGKKQIHFADSSVLINNKQSILVKKGNCLWKEILDQETNYYCKLIFFSNAKIEAFLNKYNIKNLNHEQSDSHFIIESDDYINSYLDSLSKASALPYTASGLLLDVKFEELLVYLISKYNDQFKLYLSSLIATKDSPFKNTIEKHIHSTLNLEEIAFLCNMSLSTFKRTFIKNFGIPPGKWFRDQRLLKAKELLEQGGFKASEIYLDLGYNNLSNFSSAFKKKFKIAPSSL